MVIPPEIVALVNRINRELDEITTAATTGLNLEGAAHKARKLHNMLLKNLTRRRRMREARLGVQPYKGGTENVAGG